MTRPITADVFERDGTTHVGSGVLSSDRGRDWLDDLSAEGSFGFEIKVGHSDESRCTTGRIVRFSVNGSARWQGFIDEVNPVKADPKRRQSGRVASVRGRGTLSIFEQALVYPELGLGRISPSTRYLSAASYAYDDSDWDNATALKQFNDLDDTKPWYRAPKGHKDPNAWWIGPPGGDTPPVDAGHVYYRGTFTIDTGEGGDYRFMLSVDDGAVVYVDGNKVFDEQGVGLWGVSRQFDLQLDEGEHLVFVDHVNFDRPNPATNVMGFIMSVFKLEGGGVSLGAVVSGTGAGTKMLAFPASAPGLTVGKILLLLIEENQARGGLEYVTCSFTATHDSNGVPWPDELDVDFAVGTTTVAAVIRHLVQEKKCDVSMSATGLELNAYVYKGEDLSGEVSAEYGVNIGRLAYKKTRPTGNALLVRTAEGRWWEIVDSASVAAHGRMEVGASFGSAPSDDAAQRQGEAFFEDHADETVAITDMQLEVVDAEPGEDFVVGDTIDALGDPYRVHGLRTSEDDAGHPIYTPELVAV